MNSLFRRGFALPVAAALLLAGLSIQISHAGPPELEIRDLGTFNGYAARGDAINDRGQVVGTAVAGFRQIRTFLWERGAMTELDTGDLIPVDINNRGQILMQSPRWMPRDPSACYLRDGDTTIDIGNLGGTTCFAGDLNNPGQVVGSVEVELQGFPSRHAFLWDSGVMIDLGTLGGNYSYATAINDRGQVVGASETESFGHLHAFLWEAGKMIDLGTPGDPYSVARAINNRGQVILESGSRVYLWKAGSMTDLGTMGGNYPYVRDINERGQILVSVHPQSSLLPRTGLWEDGVMTWLPALGSGEPSASRLNNRGVIVGRDQVNAADPSRVVIWVPGGAPGRVNSQGRNLHPGRGSSR